ncbi:hypothetical protein L1887_21366 [Cichorium endivia]|nr:hypothetical protein L1887_21366 [Cichorium endivia]
MPWYVLFLLASVTMIFGMNSAMYFPKNMQEYPDYMFLLVVTLITSVPLFCVAILLVLRKQYTLKEVGVFSLRVIAYATCPVLISFAIICGSCFLNMNINIFNEHGANLALVARREELLTVVAGKAKELGAPEAIVIKADVSKRQDCKRFVDETIKHFGKCEFCYQFLPAFFF